MKNNRIIIPVLALLFWSALPLWATSGCPSCPKEKAIPAVQQIEPLPVNPVSSLSEATAVDILALSPAMSSTFLHVAEMIRGRVPGVWVTGSLNFYQIRIRGAMGPPLLVIDGMPFYNRDDASLNDLLWTIPTTEVDRIEVLKSVGSAGIYGGFAGNGVIRIFTRRGPE